MINIFTHIFFFFFLSNSTTLNLSSLNIKQVPMEMENRNITNKMSTVNDIAAPNLSCLIATTMDTTMEKQHFILEHTKLNDDDYDQDQVLVPMEITNKVSAVNEIAAQTLSCLAATSIIEHDQEAENVVEKSCSQLVSMDTAITSVSISTSQLRCGETIISSTSTSTSALVVQDEYEQKKRNCVDHNKSHTTEQRTSKSTSKEEEKKLIKIKTLIANISQRCICTDSKIELMLTMEEVEREIMQDHDKRQTALCHLILFGFESNENENEAAQCILRCSNVDSESCLNSVKKDGNFLRDESSHEESADDGSFKEENGKGEGEKKRVSIIFFMSYRNTF